MTNFNTPALAFLLDRYLVLSREADRISRLSIGFHGADRAEAYDKRTSKFSERAALVFGYCLAAGIVDLDEFGNVVYGDRYDEFTGDLHDAYLDECDRRANA